MLNPEKDLTQAEEPKSAAPIRLAPAAAPEPKRRGRRRFRPATAIALIVAILAVAAAAGGFMLRADASGKLAGATAALVSTKADLARATAQVDSLQKEASTLRAEASQMGDRNAALDTKVDACQELFQLVMAEPPTPANVAKANADVVACYGSWPPWLG